MSRATPRRIEPSGPTEPQGDSSQSNASLVSSSGSLAVATLVSRVTGFARMLLVVAILGPAITSAFSVANAMPQQISELVVGQVLTALVVPVLVRAELEDSDRGQAFFERLFTMALTVLGIALALSLALSPVLVWILVGDSKVSSSLTQALVVMFLPQLLFYGLSALFSAVLNVHGSFRPGAWAPVACNAVQITTLVAYALAPGELTIDPVRMGEPKLLILGIGSTLGVVAQAAALLPALRRSGIKLRLRWGIDERLKHFGAMGLAIVIYVAISIAGAYVATPVAAHASASGPAIYQYAFTVLQLPNGVIAVALLTAIMPRLSRNAARGNREAVIDDLSVATRLTMVALIPIVVFTTFFGEAIGRALFHYGRMDAAVATHLGTALSFQAFMLIPYAMVMIHLRVFYAQERPWTPTLIILAITGVKAVLSLAVPHFVDDGFRVVELLGTVTGIAFIAGSVMGWILLRREFGRLQLTNVRRTMILTALASVLVTGVLWAVFRLRPAQWLALDAGPIGALVYLAFAGVLTLVLTYAVLAYIGVPDVLAIIAPLRRIAGRFVPALRPSEESRREDDAERREEITAQLPRIADDIHLPYAGRSYVPRPTEAQVGGYSTGYRYRRRGAFAVTDESSGSGDTPRTSAPSTADGPAPQSGRPGPSGGQPPSGDKAAGPTPPGGTPVPDSGAQRIPGNPVPKTPLPSERAGGMRPSSDPRDPQFRAGGAGGPAAGAPRDGGSPPARPGSPAVRRGPKLIPGAVVAGGRYRLIEHHGGIRGLQFWQARDINLDRDVALTFVDSEQRAPVPERGEQISLRGDGPQSILSRTLRLGRVHSNGLARVLDVVRGSSGGIVVAEWVPSSSLVEVAGTHPSAIGAAKAVRSLAAAAESAHRAGAALSIDHPDRIRISQDGHAFLAFPGTLADATDESDVRGLGAVLYALLLERWPLDGEKGMSIATGGPAVGGLAGADAAADGNPIEPREAKRDVPFEISAVASRSLQGGQGIRTAAAVQQLLDQASVVDVKTDMINRVGSEPAPAKAGAGAGQVRRNRFESARDSVIGTGETKKRNVPLLVIGVCAVVLVILLLLGWLLSWFAPSGGDPQQSIQDLYPSSSVSAPTPGRSDASAAPAASPLRATDISIVDFSGNPDSPVNLRNVLTGTGKPWSTEDYRSGPMFGNLKKGLGLMLTLDRAASVSGGTIVSSSPGSTVEVRTSPTATVSSLEQTSAVWSGTLRDGTTPFSARPGAAKTRYVLVWITGLTRNDSGSWSTSIAGVTLQGS
ncbi:lipid II flippase MurJ [Tsukamurella sp. 8F]|uniref:murein biosynthesis integral membrane protein MurJ n=1 Tax=unclassified Tsukamurella TaxID=2633480 RepID=UPI0023B926B4|nr:MULTISPECIES: lipid II flippase MurJ [unclassified Tsukamurella]MDF0529420.1 lipid II flippase MurJ [Tsukamurella sp. 8J]MDF0587073.1 lipid II flippase MurJ [Tsukamurella sp. 8F]